MPVFEGAIRFISCNSVSLCYIMSDKNVKSFFIYQLFTEDKELWNINLLFKKPGRL